MMPIFPIKLILLAIPVLLVGALVAAVVVRGLGKLKKQGAAWVITVVMIVCAIGIGYAKAPANRPAPEPYLPDAPGGAASAVWDEAGVLSRQTVRELDNRNGRLWNRHSVTIGVVTCNYGRNDLYEYTVKKFEEMGLGGYDMLVVLDIRGDNYWLYTGDDVAWDFSDEDSSDYLYDYMEAPFARGDYDSAVLQLTEMLEAWYGVYYF